jgi:glycosyltransferase involved in cell wall biosynthesis
MESQMNIALLVFSDFPDGSAIGRRTHFLSKGFAEHGHKVHVVVAQRFKEAPLYEEFDGLKVYWGMRTTQETFHDMGERLRARWAAYKIMRQLFKKRMDWLILVFPDIDRLPYLLLAKRYGVKVISTYEDCRCLAPKPTLKERLLVLRGNFADKVIPILADLNLATSKFLERRIYKIAPRTPILLFPPIVDTHLFSRQSEKIESFRSKWKLQGDIVISYLGTYWYVEGLAILLAAVSLLKEEGLKFKLLISGKEHLGFPADDVSSLIKEYRLAEFVIETGWLPTDEAIAGMSVADILVVPKLNHAANIAGMPAKLAEYLSVGSAVVASRVGDIPLYLTDYEDALLCESSDSQSLADKLKLLILDESLRQKLSTQSRDTAFKYFDYRTVSKNIEAIMFQQGKMRQ